MCTLHIKLHRAQVLLDPAQERELKEVARREGRSVSAVVRDLLAGRFGAIRARPEEATRRHLAVADRIRQHIGDAIDAGEGVNADVAALIRKDRDERDDEILAAR